MFGLFDLIVSCFLGRCIRWIPWEACGECWERAVEAAVVEAAAVEGVVVVMAVEAVVVEAVVVVMAVMVMAVMVVAVVTMVVEVVVVEGLALAADVAVPLPLLITRCWGVRWGVAQDPSWPRVVQREQTAPRPEPISPFPLPTPSRLENVSWT